LLRWLASFAVGFAATGWAAAKPLDGRLQRLRIDLVALMDIDGPPGVAFQAGVEEPRRDLP